MAICLHVCILSHVQVFLTSWTVAHEAPRPYNFPQKNTGVGCHFFLQGIFPTQESNPHLLCLLHWQVDSLLLSHLGGPYVYMGEHKTNSAKKNLSSLTNTCIIYRYQHTGGIH